MAAGRRFGAPPSLLLALAAAALVTLACVFSGLDLGSSGPTPAPTPVGDTLSYLVPVYSITLAPGDRIPGTQLAYVRQNGDAFDVLIDGLPATKRIGDSFNWQGVIAPGVAGRYNLRLSPTFTDRIVAAGPVEVSVLNPAPAGLQGDPPVTGGSFHFANIVDRFTVALGGAIPGTTMVYEGKVAQGAQIGGTGGYPYRALGDSLIWIGRLRDNVFLRYSLRVEAFDEESLRLVGTAEMWVTP